MADTTPEDEAAWRDAVLSEQRWRDDHYRGDESPLGPEAAKAFQGLAWYPLDPAYRFPNTPLERLDEPRDAALGATGDDAIAFREVGAFRFMLKGQGLSLTVFEPAPGEVDETYLFVPFQDATSGSETYGGGRYLDWWLTEDDRYDLDFNLAYHPYCVFDDAWTCTLPPPGNRLPVRVEAGERLPEWLADRGGPR